MTITMAQYAATETNFFRRNINASQTAYTLVKTAVDKIE